MVFSQIISYASDYKPKTNNHRALIDSYIQLSKDLESSNPYEGIKAGKKAYFEATKINDSIKCVKALIALADNFDEFPDKKDSVHYHMSIAEKLASKLSDAEVRTNLYYFLAYYYYDNFQYDKAKLLLTKSLNLEPSKNLKFTAKSNYLLGSIERILGNYYTALTYVELALGQYLTLGHQSGRINAISRLGQLYSQIGNQKLAIKYQHDALELALQGDDDRKKTKVLQRMGALYKNLREYTKAIEFLEQAKALTQENDHIVENGNILLTLGMIYKNKDDIDKALKLFISSYKISKSQNDIRLKLNSLNSIGNIYKREGRYNEALTNFREAYKIADEINLYHDKMISRNNIGLMLGYLGNYKKAILALKETETQAKKNNSYSVIEECYEYLADVYEMKKDYKKAYNYSQLRMNVKDSLFTQNTSKQLVEMQTNYESQVKEREIKLLKSENNLSELELASSKSYTNMLIILSAVLLFSGALGLNLYRNKRISNKKLNNNNKKINNLNSELKLQNDRLSTSEKQLKSANDAKDKFFSIIAHDLKNPIQVVRGYAELLKNNFDDYNRSEINKILGNIYDASDAQYSLLQNLLTWAMSQTGRVEFNPQDLNLLDLVMTTIKPLQPVANQKNIRITADVNPEIYVNADHEMISTVCRNLVSNAIKFSYPGDTINLFSKKNNQIVETVVEDSGVGMNEDNKNNLFMVDNNMSTNGTSNEKGTGLGLLICKEFVELNGGKIWVDSELSKGSKFHFSLPSSTLSQSSSVDMKNELT
jgi:signal transduction histidine kinase/tetratricopeptide (TPR) repeat protein